MRVCQVGLVGREQNNGINTIVCNLPAAGLAVWPRHKSSERAGELRGGSLRLGNERKEDACEVTLFLFNIFIHNLD